MAGLLSTDIMSNAGLLLNDAALLTFTYTVQIPWLKRAIDELSDELAVNNIPLLEKIAVLTPVVVGTTTTIRLPADCLVPIALEERAFGSSDSWTQMDEVGLINPNYTPANAFGIWAFQGSILNSAPVIDVPNATSAREVRLVYNRFVSTVGIDATTDFTTSLTWQCKRFVSAKVAELITRFVLQNTKRGDELKSECGQAIYRLIQIWTKKRQNRPIRKSGFNQPANINEFSFSGTGTSSGSSPVPSPATAFYDYYVRDYGAIGDGLTDDTLAIQATITAAKATGGRVLFDPKDYLVSATITVQEFIRPIYLLGYGKMLNLQTGGSPGTTIKWIGGANGIVIKFVENNAGGLRDVNIDCGTTGGIIVRANYGLQVESCVGCQFHAISVFRAAQYGFRLVANNAGVYRNHFSDLTTDLTCVGGMIHESLNAAADIASCLFERMDLVYGGANCGLDLKASDNNTFIGCILLANDGTVCGPLLAFRSASAPNFGAGSNVFLHLDGGTTSGAQRGVLCNSTLKNTCFGLDFANGLILDAASTHIETFFYNDISGMMNFDLIRMLSGRAFAVGTVQVQVYYDTTALTTRFQNHDAVTRRGWRFSGSAAAGPEVDALLISADGDLTQLGRTTPMGNFDHPVAVAGNFTANVGTWTPTLPGSIINYAIEKTGHKALVQFNIQNCSVSNAGAIPRLAIPGGLVITKEVYQVIRVVDAGGVAQPGLARASTGNNFIEFFSNVGGGGFAVAVVNMSVEGDIEFEFN